MTFQRLAAGVKKRIMHPAQDRRVVRMAEAVAERTNPKPGARPVIVFNTSTRLEAMSLNAGFSLLTAWALRLSGVPVVHFVSNAGLRPCILGTDREHPLELPPCTGCVAQSKVQYHGADTCWFEFRPDPELSRQVAGLGIEALQALVYREIPLGRLALPSLRWILRRHHLVDDEATRGLYRQYILSAESLARQFEALVEQRQPQAVLVFNGMFYPEATARWVALRHGIKVVSHEVGLMPFTGFFTTGEATAYPLEIPAEFRLNDEQNQRLDGYLNQRFRGNFSMAGVQFWPEIQNLSPEFWRRASQFRQIVPVFTNVIFDTSQGHANVVFPHMFTWLDLVHELAKTHPDTFFVIRAHPDESRPGKESRESVAGWVQASGVDRLPNVLFVDSSEYFSSYELIQKSKFVMVYNSTIGLEASIMGAAVLCGGKARFTQLPTVFFPQSEAEYRRQAEDFLSAAQITVPASFRENARRFLYYQLFCSSLPFSSFLEEDGIWKGYVALKAFAPDALRPEHSETMRVVLEGVLGEGNFLLPVQTIETSQTS